MYYCERWDVGRRLVSKHLWFARWQSSRLLLLLHFGSLNSYLQTWYRVRTWVERRKGSGEESVKKKKKGRSGVRKMSGVGRESKYHQPPPCFTFSLCFSSSEERPALQSIAGVSQTINGVRIKCSPSRRIPMKFNVVIH